MNEIAMKEVQKRKECGIFLECIFNFSESDGYINPGKFNRGRARLYGWNKSNGKTFRNSWKDNFYE